MIGFFAVLSTKSICRLLKQSRKQVSFVKEEPWATSEKAVLKFQKFLQSLQNSTSCRLSAANHNVVINTRRCTVGRGVTTALNTAGKGVGL